MRIPVFPKDNQASYETYGYSAAIKTEGFLFVSGQVGVDRNGDAVEGVQAQFDLAFENLAQVLAAAGCSFADVIDITSFHVDMFDHFEQFAAAKRSVFPEPPFPAWTAIGVVTLANPALLLEIKAIAKLP